MFKTSLESLKSLNAACNLPVFLFKHLSNRLLLQFVFSPIELPVTTNFELIKGLCQSFALKLQQCYETNEKTIRDDNLLCLASENAYIIPSDSIVY